MRLLGHRPGTRISVAVAIFRLRSRLSSNAARGMGAVAAAPSEGNGLCRKEDATLVLPPKAVIFLTAEELRDFPSVVPVGLRPNGLASSPPRYRGKAAVISNGFTRMGWALLAVLLVPAPSAVPVHGVALVRLRQVLVKEQAA